MAKQWYCLLSNNESGPFSGKVIREMVKRGEITPETLMRNTSTSEWFRAKRIKVLFPDTPSEVSSSSDSGTADTTSSSATATSSISTGHSTRIRLLLGAVPVIGVILTVSWILVSKQNDQRDRIADANSQVGDANSRAIAWLKQPVLSETSDVLAELEAAAGNSEATKGIDQTTRLLRDVQICGLTLQASRKLALAVEAIQTQDIAAATSYLQQYIADEHSEDVDDARLLMSEVQSAASDEAAQKTIKELSDDEFHALAKQSVLPTRLLPSHADVTPILVATMLRQVQMEQKRREDEVEQLRLATEKRKASERLLAEEKRNAEKQKLAEAARRKEEEVLSDGRKMLLEKRYAEAHEFFSNLLTKDPQNSTAHYLRGRTTVAQYGLRSPLEKPLPKATLENAAEESFEDLTIAIRSAPTDAERHYQRGLANFYLVSNSAEAFKDFSTAISLKPDHSESYVQRAKTWNSSWSLSRERGQLAVSDLKKAIELGVPAAEVEFRLNQVKEALAQMDPPKKLA